MPDPRKPAGDQPVDDDAEGVEFEVHPTHLKVKSRWPSPLDWYNGKLLIPVEAEEIVFLGRRALLRWGGGLWHKIIVEFPDQNIVPVRLLDFAGKNTAQRKFEKYLQKYSKKR